MRVLPACRDRAMTHLLLPEVFNPSKNPKVSPHAWIKTTFPVDQSHGHIGRATRATKGAGIPPPTSEQMLQVDALAQYLILHGRPGGTSHIPGIIFDYMYRVDRRSVFGLGLARSLAPTSPHAKTIFIRLFATVAASINCYREAVDQYNQDHPDSPFVTQVGPAYRFQRLNIRRQGPQPQPRRCGSYPAP